MDNPKKIETVTAFIAVDDEGNEGIMAFKNENGWWPMVCADEERVESCYSTAVMISALSGKEFKVVKYSNITDVTMETKLKYGYGQREN